MNIKLNRNIVISGAKNFILENYIPFISLNSITLEYCKHFIIAKIPYLSHLILEGCEDITITGCVFTTVDIKKCKGYNLYFNIIESLNVDKCSTGTKLDSQQAVKGNSLDGNGQWNG